ncbi:hypothetical protein pb186bvf_009041 [Paramecium bursaria]
MNPNQQFDPSVCNFSDFVPNSPIRDQDDFYVFQKYVDQDSQINGGKSCQITQPLQQEQNSLNSYGQQQDQNDQQILPLQDIIDNYDQIPLHGLQQQSKQNCYSLAEQPAQLIYKTKPAKNLPITFAKHFSKFATKFRENHSMDDQQTKAINQLIYFINKDSNKKQKCYGIQDIRRLCRFYRHNQRMIHYYLRDHFYMDLLLSAKIENPIDYIDHINWYLRLIKKPRLMRTNLRQ